MASLSNTLRVFSDGSVEVESVPSRKFWRVLHDTELPRELWHKDDAGNVSPGNNWRVGLPEVFILNNIATPFDAGWQLLSYALNPGMDKKKWRVVHDWRRAFHNKTGFDREGDPRADHVNRLDLASPLPKWDKTRVCGGATITGRVDGNDLIVEIMDGRGPAPTLEELKAKPWLFFRAINAGTLSNFPQGGGLPVYIPLVGSGEARIALAQLEEI